MPDWITTVLTSVALSSLITTAIIWFAKTWIGEQMKNAIKHEYDQKLETHKAELKSQSDVAVERLKSQLQIAAAERNVRFSRVFERTAETVATTYQKLLAFYDAVGHYTSIIEWDSTPPKEERRRVAGERMRDFTTYFRPNRFYLPKETANRIQDFQKKLFRASLDFMHGVEQGRDERLQSQGRNVDTWFEVNKAVSEEGAQILEQLEDDFRTILGLAGEGQIPQSHSSSGDAAGT